jgi:hypothetical protein
VIRDRARLNGRQHEERLGRRLPDLTTCAGSPDLGDAACGDLDERSNGRRAGAGVSGEPHVDLEREAVPMMARD